MKACRHPQGYAAAKMLIGYGADPNAMTSERHDFRTVLHYAVLSSNVDIVRLVLNHGANVQYPPELQKPTPLDFAILRGNLEMIKLLLDNGANVNHGSPIIGLPLHIALSEKVDNRKAIIKELLERGADPNAITLDARGPLLKPPLGEYFNATDNIDPDLTQFHHPLGILKSLHRLHSGTHDEVLQLILDAAETYNASAIKRCSLLNDSQREFLLEHALQPIALKHMTRLIIRHALGNTGPYVIDKINDLPVPQLMKMYLLYEL
ncbi:Ankyrin repeat domain-containing protein 50-like protein [Leptotrombidium deliense]|uniref:Ankyrin repeat domain-containing protein 50-like protein n=1 Tax=Leptotrombidium deliense TaxID=299467 RepID=A0A443SJE4_9ACAR|nr:Ankyrin repeat domain-containing protein 50-like protein [Leptotrombidium deliense]